MCIVQILKFISSVGYSTFYNYLNFFFPDPCLIFSDISWHKLHYQSIWTSNFVIIFKTYYSHFENDKYHSHLLDILKCFRSNHRLLHDKWFTEPIVVLTCCMLSCARVCYITALVSLDIEWTANKRLPCTWSAQ